MPGIKGRFSIYSDEELMMYLGQGEAEAFDALYERYGRRLKAYFTRMLNFNQSLAEDALQDLFLKIAESPEKFDRSLIFKTWIFSVASNYCKNYYRSRNVITNSHEEIQHTENAIDETAFIKVASRMDGSKFMQTLEEVLNSLAPEKKEAFILKYQEEKTISEIASIQNCPEGSVKSRIYYATKILEEKLKIFNPDN